MCVSHYWTKAFQWRKGLRLNSCDEITGANGSTCFTEHDRKAINKYLYIYKYIPGYIQDQESIVLPLTLVLSEYMNRYTIVVTCLCIAYFNYLFHNTSKKGGILVSKKSTIEMRTLLLLKLTTLSTRQHKRRNTECLHLCKK